MNFSYNSDITTFSPFRCLLILMIVLVILHPSISIEPLSPQHFCVDNGISYTSNRVYDSNLNTLLSSMPTNINSSGFYSVSLGQNPDRVNVMLLCRGDVQLETCRSCAQEAAVDLLTSCPNHKQGLVWNELCILRYSNESIFGILATKSSAIVNLDPNNFPSSKQFKLDLNSLIYDLTTEAAYGSNLLKVAAGNTSTSALLTIFALEQCTPDLSADDCTGCLNGISEMLPQCCDTKKWADIYYAGCQIRFGTELFYNETRLQELLVPVSAPRLPPTSLMPPPALPPAQQVVPFNGDKEETTRPAVVIIVVVSLAAGLLLSIGVGFLFAKRIKAKSKQEIEPADDSSTVESLKFDLAKIRAATNDFSDANKLGEGGFGSVYKGELQNGREIAVKRLSTDSTQGDLEFKNEVLLMTKLRHRNLVQLLGFSMEANEKLLVYEFVHNASLDKFIFDPIKKRYLNWEQRNKIIMGIARGLVYLHEDSHLRIIHRDLKPSNVLLDIEMNPKIADFGTARLFKLDETRGNTSRIVGTYGYMAPEYAIRGQLSVKLDVFSFGMMILEILTGQKNTSYQNEENVNFISFVWKHWSGGTVATIIDPILFSAGSSISLDMMRWIHIGLLCVQKNAADRPTMASVVVMLSSVTVTMPAPLEPAFFMSNDHNDDSSRGLPRISSNRSAPSVHSSENDTLISILCPR